MTNTDIVVRGAREHNLRDVELCLPRNKLIVMTGVSGSGKSSLAFDTLYAEGQRRYVESLSSYARQFLGQMPKPDVDAITGLAPSISIQQKTSSRNPRSTVGTITEIYDYLRVLFARVGQGTCAQCGRSITAQTSEHIIENVALLADGTRYQILSPIIQRQKGEYRDLFQDLLKQGYLRARVDGRVVQLTDDLQLDRQMRHDIEVVIDRLVAGKTNRSRLAEAVESALKLSGGTLIVSQQPANDSPDRSSGRKDDSESIDTLYSSHYACTECGISYEPPTPQLFSFNSPQGMCLACNGLGTRHEFVMEMLIPDEKKSIAKGAIEILGPMRKIGRWRRHIYEGAAQAIESDLQLPDGSLLKTPWKDLATEAQQLFLYGTGDRHVTYSWRYSGGIWKHGGAYSGVIPKLLENYRKTGNPMRRRQLEKYMQIAGCSVCNGTRLNQQAAAVKITSNSKIYLARKQSAALGLPEVCALSIQEAAEFFESLELDETGQVIAVEVLKEIRGRLGFLLRCGLDYLTLDRTAPTLSGGETQRIRLAGQIGCGLAGVVYILDEPSIGLHHRDNRMLLESLCDLRDQGNTVIVVEHDEETMEAADHVVDFGPGPGIRGGEIVASGSVAQIKKAAKSVTGQFLSGKRSINVPKVRRPVGKDVIKVVGAKHNNLKNVDVEFPLGTFICVTGVSGSGKSSLINDILWQVLNKDVNKGNGNPGAHTRVNGLGKLDKAIDIDQSPIGRTPRSNPATYTNLFGEIRSLFTKLPESKMRGYKPGRFSFNVPGGRCEACEGYGSNKLEMDFLADIWVTCPVCNGHRFNHETLEVRYKGANIADVLEMDVQQGIEHFKNIPKIIKLLETLHDVGLDYVKLGQPSPTLSGGEAQRIKLARELGKRSTGSTFYLLDEPTTGLHFADIEKLLEVLHGFVDAGNTVLVVEHNLDVIKTADWIIDLGPEGGAGGGTIVTVGTPEEVAQCPESHTGRALAELFSQSNKRRSAKKKKKTAAVTGHLKNRNGRNGKNIVISGAAQHNLQHINVEIPREQMSVFCGPSGSGKSSLAMDTLYAEGQRRYVESLSAYARQFLGQMPKPRVEHIHGLSPAIAIEQKSTGTTPRSTIGTVTEIYDYLRVLFARLGHLHCPDCEIPVNTQTTDEVIDKVMSAPNGAKLMILAPQEVRVGQSYDRLWENIRQQGFLRVRIDNVTYRLEEVPDIDRRRKHQVEIVVDRVTVNEKGRGRFADSIEAALAKGNGVIRIAHCDDDKPEERWQVDRYSLHFACEQCGRSFEELTPHSFSFNSALGWCEACEGIGTEQGTNLAALIDDSSKSLREGAIAAWPDPSTVELFGEMLDTMAAEFDIPLEMPYYRLDPTHKRLVLYGTSEHWMEVAPTKQRPGFRFQYKGLYPAIEEAARVSYVYRQKLRGMVGEVPCSVCHGSRLRDDVSAVRFNGMTIQQLCELPLNESWEFLNSVKPTKRQQKIAGDLLFEATSRLSFLLDVGLHYLTLSRTLPTLSGGEMQRIRLAGQIGRALTGVLYVLDEPTIGLHPRDNGRLLSALRKLRDLGNTLVLVEHDREVLEAADRLYDFGPGAGRFGGTVVGEGTPKRLSGKKSSLTGQFLSNKRTITIPEKRRLAAISESPGASSQRRPAQLSKPEDWPIPPSGEWLQLLGAKQNNLRDVDLRIPLGTFTCITGVSGSGKSSLIEDTLARAVSLALHRSGENAGPFDELVGIEHVNKVIVVDQQPLGTTPKSNPGTYTGVFDQIRELFARLPDSKVRGYTPGRFSFNRPGGRCEACEGNGQKCIEMHFLPDVWVECDDCRGKRYNTETLGVKYRGRSIADVLDMSIGDARKLFDNIPRIRKFLETLCAIGLDYLTLGQSAPTLSGGEAQRVKLAAELARPNTGKTLYILDEPTTGLHFDDIDKLLKVLNSLVELGNTVVVVEHNLDVIKTADWLIDLGPDAGNEGGWIVAEGTPEDLVEYARWNEKRTNGQQFTSYTGAILDGVLQQGQRADREVFDPHEASKKREGDLSISQLGKDAQMPWQRDGRRWHTVDRVSHGGQPCRWEGAALERVVDELAKVKGLAEPDWNDRSRVEVAAQQKSHGWFFHALTGDEWLLTMKFRVRRNQFKQDALQERLQLRAVDEIDELPVYGRGERVKVKNLKGPWQEVTVTIHWLEEIETEEFQSFLKEAVDSFLQKAEQARLNPKDLMPWKVLGRKWHLSRKGFPSGKRVKWEPELIEKLADVVEKSLKSCDIDWTGKQMASVRRTGDETVIATIHTKRREGVDLTLLIERGSVALGQVATFGKSREIKPYRDGRDAVKIRFAAVNEVAAKDFQDFLKEWARSAD